MSLHRGPLISPREGDGLPWDQILGEPVWNFLREQERGGEWECRAQAMGVLPRPRPGDTWRSPFRPIWYPVTPA